MLQRPDNFYAGPSILADSVLRQAAEGVLALPDCGLSVLEVSHRSHGYEQILFAVRDRLRRLLGVPDTHDILFLQGGARGQFAQFPLNFLRPDQRAAFIDSGIWSTAAYQEASVLGDARIVASGRSSGYAALPDLASIALDDAIGYVHTTSNNTIYGTQWRPLPHFGQHRHVCDMSSDFLSRPVNVADFACIYAGAQKNAGPAGVTIVILDRSLMAQGRQDIPSIWQYRVQAAKDSMYNTPPTFAIYCVGLVLRWIDEHGGVAGMVERAKKKTQIVHSAIDESRGYYRHCVADPTHRSQMNVTWRIHSPELEPVFVAEANDAGLLGLKGHRLFGGLRASIYNQLPVAAVERLAAFMAAFRQRH